MANPISLTTDGTGHVGATPVSISGHAGVVDPVGQVLATNATADGFEWADPA